VQAHYEAHNSSEVILMGIIKSTSKKPDGPCSFEGCKETIKQGGDYLWDFT
jgi:hypothetical protein